MGPTTARLTLITGLLTLAGPLAAQGAMAGIVREDSSGRPLPGVEVLLDRTEHRALTNAQGRYLLGDVPAGRYSAIFRAVGHIPIRMEVAISAGDTIRANATLVRSDVVLDPIEVVGETPRPRGDGLEAFEERRRMGFGRFIDSTEMRRAEHLQVDDVLQRHGVQIQRLSPLHAVAFNRRNGCLMSLFVDGVMIGSGGEGGADRDRLNLRIVRPHQLVAAEVYFGAGSIPVQFGGTRGQCGAVVLWTRRSP